VQPLDLRRAEGGRRLVEDEQRDRACGDRFRDLDELLLGNGELADDSVGIDRDLEAAERSKRASPCAAPRDQATPSGKPAEVDILRDGQRRYE
jgi:hypothetical protein